jgi:hypothetical protein
MAATTLIGITAAMIAPNRVTQIQIARIGGCANRAASNRAHRSAQAGVSGRSANHRATGRTQ